MTPTYAENPELVSVEEHQNFQPWRVALPIQRSMNEADQVGEAVYFCRAPSPSGAAHFAERFWTLWEKTEKGVTAPWPDVVGNVDITRIDEAQYAEAYAEARHYPHRIQGQARNPLLFTHWVPKRKPLLYLPS